jgi:Immunity protein Imm1
VAAAAEGPAPGGHNFAERPAREVSGTSSKSTPTLFSLFAILGAAMLICDLEAEQEVESDVELERFLMRRNGSGLNQFQLFLGRAESEWWPSLIVLVNNELAWMYYLLSPEHVGYHSVGALPELDPQRRTRFVNFGPQEDEFSNNQVVRFDDALRAAKEFFVTAQLPKCVQWREPVVKDT